MNLLDANVVIHYLKGVPAVVAQFNNSRRGDLAIPSIVIYELEYGTLKAKIGSKRKAALERGLAQIEQIPFDSAAAKAAAQIRVSLEASGQTIGPMDLLIAGTAVSRGATLITDNVKEFSRIRGLRIVSWKK